MNTVPRIRIFLSSPSDVAEERRAARVVIDRLRSDPFLRDQVDLDLIAWDDPDAATPMLATMTPQEAINRGLAKPSDCDIVIVIFWARMGTPLPPEYVKSDGERYLSGTEWEYWDAVNASKKSLDGLPLVVIYRRDGAPALQLDDPYFAQKYEQWQRVQTFFAAFTNPDGSIELGYNRHASTDDFTRQLEVHLKQLFRQVINAYMQRSVPPPPVEVPSVPVWEGSPFPGLRAFTPADEPIYFGRGAETDALVDRLRDERVVAVVGASGSGKSSLVGAGLIPRLRANSIEGSKDWLLPDVQIQDGSRQWYGLRFTPGEINDNPFDALGAKLAPLVGQVPREIAALLAAEPSMLLTLVDDALKTRPDWSEALLFIDQFEELYTLCAAQYHAPFVAMLNAIAESSRLRAVLTLRADFYASSIENTALTTLLEAGTFPLSVPTQGSLYEMITRPVERAGLIFEEGLAARILEDTGYTAGALALLAYALDQLYRSRYGRDVLTFDDYRLISGVQGAIGERAEIAFAQLPTMAQDAFALVFRELVEIDERGEPTRRRMPLELLESEPQATELINGLTNERLLVINYGESGSTVEVAHEALLQNWNRLRLWINSQAHDLQLRKRLESEARTWANASLGHKTDFLLLGSRLEEAERWLKNFSASPEVLNFIDRSISYRSQQIAAEERRKREFRLAAERAERANQEAFEQTQHAKQAALEAQESAQHAESQRQYTRIAIIATLLLIIVAAGVGIFALRQTDSAAYAQLQVETQVAALNAIVPGATQGAQWNRWASIDDNGLQISELGLIPVNSNTQWIPVEYNFNGVMMVLVPVGCFMMGSDNGGDDRPSHEQCFEKPFWIDKTEVTQAQFELFDGMKASPSEFNGDNLPVEQITWFEARDFCIRRSMRLPTEREWEYAARGPDNWVYPWGNNWDQNNAVWNRSHSQGTAKVGSILTNQSWVGALDMSGNVSEWVSSIYTAYPYGDDHENDTATILSRVIRGGAWRDFYYYPLGTSPRSRYFPDVHLNHLGFRCARST